MNMEQWLYLWLGVIIVTIIIELITVGLTSIWVAGGALVSLILCSFGAHWGIQISAFFVVTFLLLYFTRPWAMRYIDTRKTKTNYEEVIGKEVRIIEEIDNRMGTGKAMYNGMEWSAKAKEDHEKFQPEEMAKVVDVRGVKLIVEKVES